MEYSHPGRCGSRRFGSIRITRSLWRGTTEVRLTPKAFAVLHCLVERHGQLVTKDALLERVWPGTVVGDAVLKVCVREIRKALGDEVGAPRFVATVHRRGYRFIADVTDVDPRPGRGEASGRSGPTPRAAAAPATAAPAHFVGREPALDRLQTGLEAAWRGAAPDRLRDRRAWHRQDRGGRGLPRARRLRPARLDRARPVRRDVRDSGAISVAARCPRPALPRDWGRLAGHPPTPACAHLAGADAMAPRSRRPRRAAPGVAGRHARADAARDRRSGRGADGGSASGRGPRGPALE